MVITGHTLVKKEGSTIPNHIRNVVKIKNIPKDKIDYVLNKLAIKYKMPEYRGGAEEWIMDFDLIIPEPRYKKDCPKNCIVNSKSHVEEDSDRPWFNWYDWHCTYWDTEWNAYDGYTKIGKTQLTFVFNTAWSAPFTIYEKLCKLGYDMDIRYADEDIGSNCGRITYDASEHNFVHYPESELTDPVKFAKRIWDNY